MLNLVRREILDKNIPLILAGENLNVSIPPRPENPQSYPREDSRHWYDSEFMHWQVKKEPMPESTRDGPAGKRVICNIPMAHPYMQDFRSGLQKVADLHDIQLEVIETERDLEAQEHFADRVIESNPDLVIHIMPQINHAEGLYRKIYSAGIPILGSNLMPAKEDLPYILSWTGPNDWEMSRELARTFARQMNYEGGYTLIQHLEGTSCNVARTWGVITELRKIAPAMYCFDFCFTEMNERISTQAVLKWIERYGSDLKGIVSADSLFVQKGIMKALIQKNREDIITASHWSPYEALQFIKEGSLGATTYQSGIIDGTLSMQTAVDWFNGFEIPPVRSMPVHIITIKDVDSFLNKRNELPVLNYAPYTESLKLGDSKGVCEYFNELYQQMQECSLITFEYCSGVAIEILSRYISVCAERGINNSSLIGSSNPSMLSNQIMHQKSFDRTLLWLEKISLEFCTLLKAELPVKTSIEQIVCFVRQHSEDSLSLKTLSYKFNISAAYLGQLYRKETGESFSSHLNTIRMGKAKKLLENPMLLEYEVAREVGYSDASYFFRIFKKQTGMNPSEYRESLNITT